MALTTIEIDIPEGLTPEDMAFVPATDLMQLIAQNNEQKEDLGLIVGVFGSFADILTGKSLLGAAPAIIKLLSDKEKLASIEPLIPIIEKYKQHGTENED
jgi:hypothetical protein